MKGFEVEHNQVQSQAITAIVLGDKRVGKTTLVRKMCDINMQDKILPTLGIEFAAAHLSYKSREFKIKFWDISGQKKYNNLFDTYIQRCNTAIVVFDLTNFQSFHNAQEWVIQLQLNYSDIHIILFGNKKDLYEINPKSPTAVKAGVISKFVEQRGIIYEQGCGLSDNNLSDAIKKLIEKYFIPNDVIFEGINEAKTCRCLC